MKPLWFLSRCTLREMAMSITSNSLPIHFGDVLWSGSGFHNPRMLLLFLTDHSFFQVNNPCFLRGFVWISLDPIVFFAITWGRTWLIKHDDKTMINNEFSWVFHGVSVFSPSQPPFSHHDHAMMSWQVPVKQSNLHGAGGNESRELHAFLGLHPVQFLAFLRERFGAQAARLPLKKNLGYS